MNKTLKTLITQSINYQYCSQKLFTINTMSWNNLVHPYTVYVTLTLRGFDQIKDEESNILYIHRLDNRMNRGPPFVVKYSID